jgi:glycerate dehydrogenase
MTKIVFLDAYTTNPGDVDFSPLESLGDFSYYPRMTDKELHEAAGEADIVISNKYAISNHNITHLKSLKYICVAATGVNNIDLSLMKTMGIPVSNAAAYSTQSVVQQVIASVLAVLNEPEHYFQRVRSGAWKESPDFCFYDRSIPELAAMKVGILGYGNIGKALATVFHAFGCEVFVHTRTEIADSEVHFCNREILFEESDILSLHVPLTSETSELINKDSLNKMKDSAILVNTGRGGLINEADLLVHLSSHPQFTAILDVLNQEPPLDDFYSELFSMPNCKLTPHIAWAGREARQRLIGILSRNIKSFLMGETIQNQVV